MKTLCEYNTPDLYIHHTIDEHPNPAGFTMHIHECFEIYLFISGSASYLVEGTEYPLTSGCMLIMRASETHMVKILDDKKYERYSVIFSPSILDKFDPEHSLIKPFIDRPLGVDNIFYPSDFNAIHPHDYFQSMCAYDLNEYDRRIQILTHLLPLLNAIKHVYSSKEHMNHSAPELSAQMIAYINLHLFQELSVSSIAEHFFISTSQLGRIFKKATGTSVWEYITIKRLTIAKEKIKKGLPAHIACTECGFGDYSSFFRAYVKRFGKAPTD